VSSAELLQAMTVDWAITAVDRTARTWCSSLWRWMTLSERVTPISLQKLLIACTTTGRHHSLAVLLSA